MRLLITGGTGFIGRQLIKQLLKDNHQVIVLSRQPRKDVRTLLSTQVKPVSSLATINTSMKFDAIINLAGEGIADKRWSPKRKKELLDSRVKTTNTLVKLMERLTHKPECFISASAIGYYGTQRIGEVLDESADKGDDFAAKLSHRWERAAMKAKKLGIRTCIARIGVVLHPDGGALQKMLPAFKLGIGGTIGSGKQIFSWIHLQDLVNALQFMINTPEAEGPYNCVAPEVTSNKVFTKALGRAIFRPTLIPTPKLLISLLLGESAILLNEGQAVAPAHLIEQDFQFQYPTISSALNHLMKSK